MILRDMNQSLRKQDKGFYHENRALEPTAPASRFSTLSLRIWHPSRVSKSAILAIPDFTPTCHPGSCPNDHRWQSTSAVILFCGTGIGASVSLGDNMFLFGAALTHDTYSAERAAKSNNAQIITMGARVIGPELAKAIVDKWLESEFDPNGSSAGNVQAINRLDAVK